MEIITCVGHMRIIKLRSVEQKQKSTFEHNKQQLYIQFNCQYINMETTTYNLSYLSKIMLLFYLEWYITFKAISH